MITQLNSRSNRKILSVGAICLLVLTACTTNPYTGERQVSKTAKGAGIGAAVGAVIGALTGDDADERRKRALIGAGAGAIAGGAVGAYMDVQERKLRERLQGTGVHVVRMGDDLVLGMPGNVTFDVNRADLRSDFLPVLDSVGLVLGEYKKTLIDVTGHTDSSGGRQLNMALSQRRADSVARYLAGRGLDSRRVLTQGVGPDYPVADNRSDAGRQQNRRVELILKPIVQG